jgi:hypothetical protein
MLSSPGMSAASAGGPLAPTPVERVGRLAGVRAWWLAALLWGAVALLAAIVVQAQLAWGWAPPWPFLGAGRLLAAYRLAARFGAFALPLMALLARAPQDGRDDAAASPLGWSWCFWNLGILVGVLGALAGWMRPEPWAPQPVLADLLLLAGAFAWLRRVWLLAGPQPDAASRAAIAAGIGLLACIAFGGILVQALGGLGQALGGALMGRGIDDLALATAAFGSGAVLVPVIAGRPLFGRRSWVWGLWAWLGWAVLRLPADLVPDLLGPGAARAMDSLTPLGLVPLLLLAVALAGCFVGAPAQAAVDGLGPRSPGSVLILAGLAWLFLGRLAEAATSPGAARLLQFSAAAPRAAELPSWTAMWCLSAGLVWLLAGGRDLPRGRWIAGIIVTGAASQGLLVLPMALVELAVGASAERLGLEAGLRLPANLLLLAGWLAMAALLWRHPRWNIDADADETPSEPPTAAPGRARPMAAPGLAATRSDPTEGPGLYGATVAALIGAGLLLTVILPLASQGAASTGAGGLDAGATPADALAGGLDAPLGRAVYVSEGCVYCHTRRVREGWDPAAMGPPTRLVAQGSAPALAGLRRAGPDLAWVGDRLVDAPERVAVHAAGGRPAFPWRFDAAGAGPSGGDLMDFLAGQRSPEGVGP